MNSFSRLPMKLPSAILTVVSVRLLQMPMRPIDSIIIINNNRRKCNKELLLEANNIEPKNRVVMENTTTTGTSIVKREIRFTSTGVTGRNSLMVMKITGKKMNP